MFFKYFFSCCFKCFLATPMMLSSYVKAQPAVAFLERSKQAFGEWNTVTTFHYKTERTSTITPAIKVTREFAAYLSDRNIKYNRIIGHHGHAAITPGIFNDVIKAQKN